MRILNLKLENFQGIRKLELNLDGKNASIYGDNATGKTTIANAWSWMLFGKAASDIKNFTPKTKDGLGDVHHLINSVEAKIQLDDGLIVTLRKVHKEKWTKKRGAETEEMTGEGDEYYIDDVPKKQKEYDAYIENITANTDVVKMLTTVNYFPEVMKWDKRRALLLEICGNITDDEIIEHSTQLQQLNELLIKPGTSDQRYSVDELLKIKKASISKINNELDQIPALINEAKKAMPDVKGLSETKLKKSRDDLNVKIQKLNNEISDLKNGSPERDYERRLDVLNEQMRQRRLSFDNEISNKRKELNFSIKTIEGRISDIDGMIANHQRSIKTTENDIEYMKKASTELKKQFAEIIASSFPEDAAYCPTCHQALPSDQVEKLRNNFNIKKSKSLEEIQERGKKNYSSEAFAELQKIIDERNTQISSLKDEKEKLNIESDGLRKSLSDLNMKRFEDTDQYSYVQNAITELKERYTGGDTSLNLQIEGRNKKIDEANQDLDEINRMISEVALAKKQEERVKELTLNQKKLSAQFSEDEKAIYMCEQFIMAKTGMVTAVINNHFESIKFNLFDHQMNGGIKECCDVLVPSPEGAMVPYQFANSAGKLNAGLEIISTLSTYYGLNLPVFIDNAEGVTKLNHIDNQIIRLVVSEVDKQLRIELD